MYIGLAGLFLIWVFFLYGVLEFIRKLLFEIRIWKDKKTTDTKPLIVVKEQGENIESILRILHGNGIEVDIITLPSSDDTSEIVEKLSHDLMITKINYK